MFVSKSIKKGLLAFIISVFILNTWAQPNTTFSHEEMTQSVRDLRA